MKKNIKQTEASTKKKSTALQTATAPWWAPLYAAIRWAIRMKSAATPLPGGIGPRSSIPNRHVQSAGPRHPHGLQSIGATIVFGISTRPTSARPKSPSNTACTLDIASSKTKENDGSLRRATLPWGRVYKTTFANFQITIRSSHLHPRIAFDVLCFAPWLFALGMRPPTG